MAMFPESNHCSKFPKLEVLDVKGYHLSESIFPLVSSKDTPLLETVTVKRCDELKYVFGIDQHVEFRLLRQLELCHLPNFMAMFRESNHGSKFPKLEVLHVEECPLLESLFPLVSCQDIPVLDTITIKKCDGLKYVFGIDQHVEFRSLRQLELCHLPNFTAMFHESDHVLKFPKLEFLDVEECPLLESLNPFLSSQEILVIETLKIKRCDGLKYVFGIDQDGSNSKFPKLEVLDVEECPLLESMFPFLVVQDLPVLETIKIKRCDGLKYVFGIYQHVEFHSLRHLELCQLPKFIDMFRKSSYPMFSLVKGASESNSYHLYVWDRARCPQIQSMMLYNIRKIELSQFSKIKSVFMVSVVPKMLLESLTIRNCDKLEHIIDFGDYDSGNNNWGSIFPNLKELYIEGCVKLKYIFGRDTFDQQNNKEILLNLPTLEFLSLLNLPSLEATCPKRFCITFPPLAKLKLKKCPQASNKSIGIFINVSESESLDSPNLKEYGNDQIAIPTHSNSTNAPLNVEDETTKTNNQADTFQKVEDLGSSLLVSVNGELEQLVSKKYLDYENWSLMTDFLVKHPSVLLKDTSLSNRYKGYAYSCLAELLKFLQTHSVLDVLGSSHSEFVELIQDMRKFPFDKEWLDGVEKRALYPDMQFSQGALRKLMEFKKKVIEEAGEMRLKTYLFNQHVEDLKHQLKSPEQLTPSEADLLSIIKEEARVSETKAALIAPLGY